MADKFIVVILDKFKVVLATLAILTISAVHIALSQFQCSSFQLRFLVSDKSIQKLLWLAILLALLVVQEQMIPYLIDETECILFLS